jgi:glycyl-tRNA synthetase beta subunit
LIRNGLEDAPSEPFRFLRPFASKTPQTALPSCAAIRFAKGFQKKGKYASSIVDLESYLLTAFRHRFHRFLKAEQERHEVFQPVSGPLNLDLLETTQNAEWVSQLERKIAVRQVTDRMDGWTKKVWQARQYGYSWKEFQLGWGSRSTKRR